MKKFLLVLFSVFSLSLILSCDPDVPSKPSDGKDVDVSGCYLEESSGCYFILEKSDSDIKKGTVNVSGVYVIDIWGDGDVKNIEYKLSGTYKLDNGSVVIDIDDNVNLIVDGGEPFKTSLEALKKQYPDFNVPEISEGTYSVEDNILLVTDTSSETPVTYKLVNQPLKGDYEIVYSPMLIIFESGNINNIKFNFEECGVVTVPFIRKNMNYVLKGNWKVSSDNKLTVKMTEGTKDGEPLAAADIPGWFDITDCACGIYNKVFYIKEKDSPNKIIGIWQAIGNTYKAPTKEQVTGSWTAVYTGSGNIAVNDTLSFNSDGSFVEVSALSTTKGTWEFSDEKITVEYTETKLANSEEWAPYTGSTTSAVYTTTTDGDLLVLTKTSNSLVKYCFKK